MSKSEIFCSVAILPHMPAEYIQHGLILEIKI